MSFPLEDISESVVIVIHLVFEFVKHERKGRFGFWKGEDNRIAMEENDKYFLEDHIKGG